MCLEPVLSNKRSRCEEDAMHCSFRGYGNPLQYYCLENPMDRGAW